MYPVIFIVGPTATGKSEAVFSLAHKLGAEIVSCDSMLIYQEPNIITSKPSSYMLDEIKHHMISIISVSDQYNVYDYYEETSKIILDLYKKGKPVIVCGGSGLYVKVLLDGIFQGAGKDEFLRKSLEEKEKESPGYLYNELKRIDSKAAEKISRNDKKRLIRALEVYCLCKTPISDKQKDTNGLIEKLPINIFGFRLSRELLYERINKRVDMMFREGALNEIKSILKLNLSETAQKMIGLSEVRTFLDGESTLDEAKDAIKKNTRNFSKRQITWFKKEKRIQWIDIDNLSTDEIPKIIFSKLNP